MKVSFKWLKDYVSPGIAPEKLAERLTMAGLEVEKIQSINGDTVFEIEVTPNRPDCLNMWGIAREVAAILNKSRKTPAIKKFNPPKTKCDIEIVDKVACLRYIGTVIHDVQVAATPQVIKERIEALGSRSINNVVDITNFVLMETGQPLHAFDYDKLEGGKIIVRRARASEKIVTLDGKEHTLDPSILVIADAKRAVAIAGVMGGKDTEVTNKTKNIFLESAYFDPFVIRRGSRKLGLKSDSSYRFERGVGFEMVKKGSERALGLILDSAKGQVKQYEDIISSKRPSQIRSIALFKRTVDSLVGANLSLPQCKNILKKLDFEVKTTSKETLKVIPPSFRNDIKEEIDLIEEICRIVGYDQLPMSLPTVKLQQIPVNRIYETRKKVRQILVAQGLSEVITYAMVSKRILEKSNQGLLTGIEIQNPLSQDQELMRPSLLPNFLSIVATNLNRGQKDLKFFEAGKIYPIDGEKEVLGLAMIGLSKMDWRETKKEVNFYDIKGAIEQLIERFGVEGITFLRGEYSYLEEGQAAQISLGNEDIGVVGKVRQSVLEGWEIKAKNVFFAQIDFERLMKQALSKKFYAPVVEFPAMTRDVSLAVKKETVFQEVVDIAKAQGGKILTSIRFNEEYLGENLAHGHRGLIFSLTYQSPERTLKDAEVNDVHGRVLSSLQKELQATIR